MTEQHELTAAVLEKIQGRLRELLDQGDIALGDLVHFTRDGYGKTAWSQFIGGKYKGDVQKMGVIAQDFLRRRDALEGLAETRAYLAMQKMYQVCDQRRELGVIAAPSGLGKTLSAKAYAQAHPNVIYIASLPHISDSGLLEIMKMELGLKYGQNTPRHERALQIMKQLRTDPQLILVDEANHLSVAGLDMLRSIHDDGNCGMVLQGDEKVVTTIKSGGKKENLAQLYSRVRRYIALERPDDEDIRRFCEYKGMPLNGNEKVLRKIHDLIGDAGEFRKLGFILDQIDDMHQWDRIKEKTLTLEHITLAHKALIEREM